MCCFAACDKANDTTSDEAEKPKASGSESSDELKPTTLPHPVLCKKTCEHVTLCAAKNDPVVKKRGYSDDQMLKMEIFKEAVLECVYQCHNELNLPVAQLQCWQNKSCDDIQAGDHPAQACPTVTFCGKTYALNVTEIECKDKTVSDITPLKDLSSLQVLKLGSTQKPWLWRTQVSDLTPLKGLINLKELWLGSTQVSDLSPLKGLNNLQDLVLSGTQVSDLTPLKGLTNLQKLHLSETQVVALTPLKGLSSLKMLDLWGTQVSDLSPLKSLNNLEWLYLGGAKVKDLTPLKGLNNLQWLWLKYTKVSDLSPVQHLIEAGLDVSQ